MEICDVNKPMDPAGIAAALATLKEEAGPQPVELPSAPYDSPSPGTPPSGRGIDDLFEDDAPVREPNQPPTLSRSRRPSLDAMN